MKLPRHRRDVVRVWVDEEEEMERWRVEEGKGARSCRVPVRV